MNKQVERDIIARATQREVMIEVKRSQDLLLKVMFVLLTVQMLVIAGGTIRYSQSHSSGNPLKAELTTLGLVKEEAEAEKPLPASKAAAPQEHEKKKEPSEAEKAAAQAAKLFEGMGTSAVLNPAEAAWLDQKELTKLKRVGVQ